MDLSQEAVLSFLLERGGSVKNSELLRAFSGYISCGDPAEKQRNRELFKRLVNSVAVVRQAHGVKFVVLKKRYQDFVKPPQQDDSFSSQNRHFCCTSPPPPPPPPDVARSAGMICADAENNSVGCPPHIDPGGVGLHVQEGSLQKGRGQSCADATTVKVLNISAGRASRPGGSGAVFVVVGVKSPQREQSARDGFHSQVHQLRTPDQAVSAAGSGPVPDADSVYTERGLRRCQGWQTKQTEAVQHPGFPQMRTPDETTEPPDDAKYSESVPLEPLAHEWLVKCAAGKWSQVWDLLLQDARLAWRRDFMSGFSALHWAAKDGNAETILKIMDVCGKSRSRVNVNCKAHGGYTPLHIAAIHGRVEVMALLVRRYRASVHQRDNGGKRAIHYLGRGAPAEVRALLGGAQQSKQEAGEEDREQTKTYTVSRLFQPHMGKKHKTTA
ncbi:ankyrin repeat domain-containing protein SOWAHA-like [Pholidichthys leucotaenia]